MSAVDPDKEPTGVPAAEEGEAKPALTDSWVQAVDEWEHKLDLSADAGADEAEGDRGGAPGLRGRDEADPLPPLPAELGLPDFPAIATVPPTVVADLDKLIGLTADPGMSDAELAEVEAALPAQGPEPPSRQSARPAPVAPQPAPPPDEDEVEVEVSGSLPPPPLPPSQLSPPVPPAAASATSAVLLAASPLWSLSEEELLAALPAARPAPPGALAEEELGEGMGSAEQPTLQERPAEAEAVTVPGRPAHAPRPPRAPEDDFYDTISIENQDPGAVPAPARPSAATPRPEDLSEIDFSLTFPGATGTTPQRPQASLPLTPLRPEAPSRPSVTPPPGHDFGGEHTPVPAGDAEAPALEPHTITLEAELPPSVTSQLSPLQPSTTSVPSAAVLSQLSRSSLTPPPLATTGELVPRRLPLPDTAGLALPARLPAGRLAPPTPAERAAELALLDGELQARLQRGQRGREVARLALAAARQAEALGEGAEAGERYRTALELDERSRPALRGLRRVYSQLGPAALPDEATALLAREAQGAGKHERLGLLLQRGELHLLLGQAEAAQAAFSAALADGDEVDGGAGPGPLWAALGLCDAEAGHDAGGIMALAARPGIQAHPGLHAALHIHQARLEEGQGRDEEAAEQYRGVLGEAPAGRQRGPAALGLLRTAARRGSSADQRAACAALAEVTGDGALRTALWRAGDAAAAGRACAAGDRLALEDQAEAAVAQGEWVRAAMAWQRLAERITDPSRRADALLQAAQALEQAGDLAAAHEILGSAEKDAMVARARERVALRLGQPAGLREVLERQRAMTPDAPHVHVGLARLLATSGETAAGEAHPALPGEGGGAKAQPPLIDAVRAALALRPDFAPAVALVRELLLAGPAEWGGAAEAARVLLRALETQGGSLAAGDRAVARRWRRQAAQLLAAGGHLGEAVRLLRDDLGAGEAERWLIERLLGPRLELVPETEPALAALLARTLKDEAEAAEADGDRARAADLWYRRARVLEPGDARLHQRPAVLPPGPTPVEDALEHAFRAAPGHGPALVTLLGRALGGGPEGVGAGDRGVTLLLERCRERLRAAAGRPEAVMWVLRLGAVEEHEARDRQAALRTLDQLRELAPGLAGGAVIEGLWRLTWRAEDRRGARALLERALEGEQDADLRFALLMQIGELHEHEGQPAAAARTFTEARQLRPEHPAALQALARALEAAGEHEELRALWQGALAEATDLGTRAAAQERLAILAEQESGGPGLSAEAVAAYEQLLQIDAGHHVAMRALERHLMRAADWGELIHLYEQMGLTATDTAFAVHVHLDRARLRQRLAWQGEVPLHVHDELVNQLENDFRLALYRDRHSRPALRHVLASALRTQDLHQVADLSTRLAEICDLSGTGQGEAGDGRAAAVFLTRAAECYAALQHSPETVTLAYRAALERNPLHLPALRGLLHYALQHGLWSDAAEAAERCAAALHDTRERGALYLLAGAVAQEHLGDTARALADYREAQSADPGRSDAFERMRVILVGHAGAPPDAPALADLLRDQILIEGDAQRQIALRLELAQLLREPLGNRGLAKVELRQALSADPNHPAALEALASLHYEDGEWSLAVDALLRRARVERRPEELAEIFVRLGQIYSEPLPDARRAVASFTRALEIAPGHPVALAQLSGLHLSQGRPEEAVPLLLRLAAQVPDHEQKVAYLHRVARIQEGLGEQRAAAESFRQAVELDPMYLPAVGALASFYDRQSDVQSMRVHLDRAAARWRALLRDRPEDPAVYQALFQLAQWRRAPDQAALVAGVLQALAGGRPLPSEVAAVLERERGRVPSGAALRDPAFDELLFPASVPPGLRNLFGLLSEPLGKLYRADFKKLEALGVSRREKLPRSGHPVRDLANRLAADLGAPEFDIYLTQGALCQVEATEPVSLVLGQGLLSGATEGELRFLLGRLLKIVASRLVLPLVLPPEDVHVLVGGLVRHVVKDYAPIGVSERRVAAEAQRLGKVIPRKLEPQLLPFALECASAALEMEGVPAQLWVCANHAGLLLAGGAAPAVAALRRLGSGAEGQAAVHELLRFAVTEEAAEMRRLLLAGQ